MSRRGGLFRRLLSGGWFAISLLLVGLLAPGRASAQWSVCINDPKVWLDDGAQVSIKTTVNADPSVVTQLAFTLHVPAGTSSTRIVYTGGKNGTIETVNVVQDSPGGYQVDAFARSSDRVSYPVNLSVHQVNHGSYWSSTDGITNQTFSSSQLGV